MFDAAPQYNNPHKKTGRQKRRNNFNETDEIISKKIKEALNVGLNVIFCVGEKEGEDKKQTLTAQIEGGLSKILPARQSLGAGGNLKSYILNLIIAYEPVWAIGTGKNCSVEETLASISLIRDIISGLFDADTASSMKILYGGSVSPEDSALYLKEEKIGGLLVGGASLNAEDFIKIAKSIKD